jgi:CheY-like chemotaxis protein
VEPGPVEPGPAVVVDDDPVTRRLITVLLQREGYRVHGASHGEAGLQLVREVLPSLLMIDAMMPEMDGYELCARVRADAGLAHQPRIVMITATGHDSDRDRALGAGVDLFMTKPFSPSRLVTALRHLPGQE